MNRDSCALTKNKFMLRLIRFWPPYLGTGIRVTGYSSDLHSISVQMRLGFYNRNIVGVHFGGSIYSMCDPWLMWIAMIHLNKDYTVWDKAAEIKFLRPGRTVLTAKFTISAEEIAEFRTRLTKEKKIEPQFQIDVNDDDGNKVASVIKTLYIKKNELRADDCSKI